jgi:F-box protein 11
MAFMSYVRVDDQHEGGRLSQLRDRLSAEVRMQAGEEFPIFQDRTDIRWGQNWKERLESSVDAVTFLIPIITPSYFRSQPCRDELERFLAREAELQRNDLVLPVYYVSTPLLDDPARRAADNLAEAVASHQYVDWRQLRFEAFTSPQIGLLLAQMAVQIRDALERAGGTPPAARPAPRRRAASTGTRRPTNREVARVSEPAAEDAGVAEVAAVTRAPTARTEQPARVVDQMGGGDHTSITDAIRAAKSGDRILVRPGLYQEALVMDKPLEIIGDGEMSDITVQATGAHTVAFQATTGRVANLTLKQAGGGKWYCVDIAQGRLVLEGCDITSLSLACVAIHGGADPRLKGNRIHDGKEFGVFVYDQGQGMLEGNDIFGNYYAGVCIATGGNPTLRRNRIHDCTTDGVSVIDQGQGTLEDNDIFGNRYTGVLINTGGKPTLRRNRIHSNNLYGGIRISSEGGGTFEDNDLRGNAGGAWSIDAESAPLVKRARNRE